MATNSDKKSTQAALAEQVRIGPWRYVPRKERGPFARYPHDVEGFVARYVREHRPGFSAGKAPVAEEAAMPVFASLDEARAAYGAALTEALQVLGMPLGEIEGMNRVMDLLPRGMAEQQNLRGICAGKAPLWPHMPGDIHVLMRAAMEARKEHRNPGPERAEDVDWAKLERLADAVNQQPQAQFRPSVRTR